MVTTGKRKAISRFPVDFFSADELHFLAPMNCNTKNGYHTGSA